MHFLELIDVHNSDFASGLNCGLFNGMNLVELLIDQENVTDYRENCSVISLNRTSEDFFASQASTNIGLRGLLSRYLAEVKSVKSRLKLANSGHDDVPIRLLGMNSLKSLHRAHKLNQRQSILLLESYTGEISF